MENFWKTFFSSYSFRIQFLENYFLIAGSLITPRNEKNENSGCSESWEATKEGIFLESSV